MTKIYYFINFCWQNQQLLNCNELCPLILSETSKNNIAVNLCLVDYLFLELIPFMKLYYSQRSNIRILIKIIFCFIFPHCHNIFFLKLLNPHGILADSIFMQINFRACVLLSLRYKQTPLVTHKIDVFYNINVMAPHLSVLRGCANYVIKGRVLASLRQKKPATPCVLQCARARSNSSGGGGGGNTVDYLHMF